MIIRSNGSTDAKLDNTNDPLNYKKGLNLHSIVAELFISMCTEFHLLLYKLRSIIFRYSIIILGDRSICLTRNELHRVGGNNALLVRYM